MDSQHSNKKICFEETLVNMEAQNITVDKWDRFKQEFVKTIIQINYTKEQYIIYSQDGVILRMQDQIRGGCKSSDILSNVDQIQYLFFQGQYEQNERKSGRWRATWDGEVIENVGGYDKITRNPWFWKELNKNYCRQQRLAFQKCPAEIFKIGEYSNDQKIGLWKFFYDDKQIGGGFYDGQAQKTGKWIEVSNGFNKSSQVTYHGEYKKGNKVGIWDIFFVDIYNTSKQIGGGLYDINGNDTKNGKWIELSEWVDIKSCITLNGEYKTGRKIGRWDILIYKYQQHDNREIRKIGGGLYDDKGEGTKIGRWIEIKDKYDDISQIIFTGEYHNGIKNGNWDILFSEKGFQNYEKIGGGSYKNELGKPIKIKNWVESSDNYKANSKVVYTGEYKNGQKVGRWETQIKDLFSKNNQLILGGTYKESESGSIKIGRWVELSNDGEYNKGKKVGRWDNWYNWSSKYQMMGGGLYDERSIKIGKWTELSEEYSNSLCIMFNGEYKDSKKVGKWQTNHWQTIPEKNKKIGGGVYDQMEGYLIKVGKWVELSDDYKENSQITYSGEYKKGKKVGKWDTWYKDERGIKNKLIGGGSYDDINSIKIGKWIELKYGLRDLGRVVCIGNYKNGSKTGEWHFQFNKQKIDGGCYDEVGEGIKIGKWTELSDIFDDNSQNIYKGEYKNGKKIGIWELFNIFKNKQLQWIDYN